MPRSTRALRSLQFQLAACRSDPQGMTGCEARGAEGQRVLEMLLSPAALDTLGCCGRMVLVMAHQAEGRRAPLGWGTKTLDV